MTLLLGMIYRSKSVSLTVGGLAHTFFSALTAARPYVHSRCGAGYTQVPLPVNITTGNGTVTYITLSAVNTTGKPGNLTVLQVMHDPVLPGGSAVAIPSPPGRVTCPVMTHA